RRRAHQRRRVQQFAHGSDDVLDHTGVRRGGEQHGEIGPVAERFEDAADDLAGGLRRHRVLGQRSAALHGQPPGGGNKVNGTTVGSPSSSRQWASTVPWSSNDNSARTTRYVNLPAATASSCTLRATCSPLRR